jgi:anti-anti-sigma factor
MKHEPAPKPHDLSPSDDPIASSLFRGKERTILIESVDSTAVLRIHPGVTHLENTPDVAANLLTELTQTISSLEPKPERVVLNMQGVDYMGLSSVGVLFQIHQISKKGEGPAIALVGLEGQPATKLQMTRLDRIIPCFKDVAEAIESPQWPKAA